MSSPKETVDQKEKKPVEKKDKKKEKETKKQVTQWQPVWDDNAQAYYWWNTDTNETTWSNPAESTESTEVKSDNPLDSVLDRIDNEVKKKLDKNEPKEKARQEQDYSAYYYNYYDQPYYDNSELYATQAHFNTRTGRFTAHADYERLNPEAMSIEARATRQMQNYFDVELYTEQRNRERMLAASGRIKKKPLTRKEVEYFKKMKKEKKSKRAREWLLD